MAEVCAYKLGERPVLPYVESFNIFIHSNFKSRYSDGLGGRGGGVRFSAVPADISFATGNVHLFLCPSDMGYDIDSCDCEKQTCVGVGFIAVKTN